MSTFHVNHFQPQPAPLAPTRPQPAHAPQPLRGNPANAETTLVPRAAIDSEGVMREGVTFQQKSLGRRQHATRLAAPAQRQGGKGRAPAEAGRKQGPAERSGEPDPELHLESVEQALDMLRDDSSRRGRAELEAILAERHAPMDQWRVLADALDGVDDQNLSNYKKKVLREAITEMMADIVERDMSVRKALQASDVSGTLEAAVEGSAPKSARELRFLITEKGSIDKPLTPLTTLKAVIRHLGVENVEKAIAMLCSQMLSGL